MNHKSLDHLLRATSDTEARYLEQPPYPSDFCLEQCHTVVYQMPEAASELFIHHPHPLVSMVKTHRYRPVLPHVHPWIELGYMYSGSCMHMVRDQVQSLRRGQIYILDSGAPHAVDCLGTNDILISMVIDKEFFEEAFFHQFAEESVLSRFLAGALSLKSSHDNYLFFPGENSRKIPFLMNELMLEHIEPSGNARSMTGSLISLLFLELVNVYEHTQSLRKDTAPLVPILRYIQEHYLDCSLTSTAAAFSLSPNYLTSLLRKQTGQTFKELVQQQRLYNITSLLQDTALSIEEIARRSGYDSTTYFYRKFREAYGCSPKEFREKCRRTGPSNPEGS